MTFDWTPLRAEFQKWRSQDLILPIWWRDDDAQDVSPELETLISLSEHLQIPVYLAVVPRGATRALAIRIAESPSMIPVVHGWSHTNHAEPTANRSEFPNNRPSSEMLEELVEGKRRLERLFGEKLAPVFVPPWNHIGSAATQLLPDAKYKVLSVCDPRPSVQAGEKLVQLNTHLDPIAWREGEILRDPAELISHVTTNLRDRRKGKTDNREPFGLLTHHLAMKDDAWEFTQEFWQEILKGPVEIAEISTS